MRVARLSFCLAAIVLSGLFAALLAQQPGDLLRRGSALMHAERSAEAEAVLKSIGDKDPDYPTAQTLLGYIYMRRSALEQAERAFQRALAAEANSAAARFGLGMAQSRQGLLENAAGQFEKVFEDPPLGAKARSQWIQTLFWMGRDEEAYKEARRLSLEFPAIAEYQSLVGFLSHVKGDTANARRAFEHALELDPARLADYFSLISLCQAQKDWKAALHWINEALARDRNQPLLYDELAVVCARLGLAREAEAAREEGRRRMEAEIFYAKSARARAEGRPGESEKFLRQSLQANPVLSKAWTDLGEISRENDRPDEALQSFERALKIEPSNLLARLGAAAVLEERTENAERSITAKTQSKKSRQTPDSEALSQVTEQANSRTAASIVLRAIEDFPDNADLLAFLGRIQESSGSPQAAAESYSEALRIDPLQVQAILGKAKYFLAAGEIRRAIEEFRRAADLEPGNLQTWRGLVQAQREAGDRRAAEAACRQCLDNNSGDPDCLELLAYLKMNGADYRAASELFQTILRDGRASKDLLDSQGFARMKLGEAQEAIDLFESSLKRFGPDAWVYFNLGYLYQGLGNIPPAIANYRRAREISPQDPETNHNFAFALYLARNFSAALEPFKTAVRLKPDWALAHFNLAMTYWNLRQYAPALMHARIAEEKGLPGAARVVQALSANLSLGMPRTVTVQRKK